MDPVYSYIDYRRFLRDFYKEQKQLNRHFSYRYFIGRAGLSSPVFLKLVIEGKRNLTIRTIEAFSRVCKLNKSESRFFRHLVLFNQSRMADEKQEHYAVMASMASRVKKQPLDSGQYEYLSRWYHPVVRELVCLPRFSGDMEALAQAVVPPIRKTEARSSVRMLERLGLIVQESDGRYRQADRALSTNREMAGLAIRAFNKAMIERAAEAIDSFTPAQRHISGMTMGVSPQCYHVLCAEIEAFKERIAAIVDNDREPDPVYQLNIQLFMTGKFGDAPGEGDRS